MRASARPRPRSDERIADVLVGLAARAGNAPRPIGPPTAQQSVALALAHLRRREYGVAEMHLLFAQRLLAG